MDATASPANPDFREPSCRKFPAGRRQNARREDGTRWNYAYNNRSEVTGASKRTAANGQVPGLNFGYEYDGIGNRTKAWSGTAGTSGSPTWEYTSNALNQYIGIKHSGPADILTRSDEPVTATVTGATAGTVVTLDQFHAVPLSRVSTDDTHGRLSTTTVRRSGVAQTPVVTTWFPPANRVTGTGGKLAYDADGNLLTDGRWNYTWDGENRLVKMTPVILSPSPINGITTTTSATLSFTYDWMGRRIGKITEQGSGKTTMAYAYDHWNPVAEWLRPNVLTPVTAVTEASLKRTHLWGLDIGSSGRVSAGMRTNFQAAGGVGGLIASTWHASSNPQNRYIPGYDANGNIMSWSCVSGTLSSPTPYPALQRRDYDPFGNAVLVETMATGAVADNIPDFGFSTKLEDKQTGLYYYGYRYYDPVTGRWPSRDPIAERGGANIYGFVTNGRTSRYDLLGLYELGDDQIADHSQADCKCGITIDVAHGGFRSSKSTQRANEREKCHRYFSVGCGSNYLNGVCDSAGIGLPATPRAPKPPQNNQETNDSDALESEGFDRNDICLAKELFPNVDSAIGSAKASAPSLCSSCKCKLVLLRINCAGDASDPIDILRIEEEEWKNSGRQRTCNTTIKIPCK